MSETENKSVYSKYAIFSLIVIFPLLLIPAGLRLGAIWLLAMSLTSIVLAILARKEIRNSEGNIAGGWCAAVGATLGSIVLLIFVGVMISKLVVTADEKIFRDFHKEIGKYLSDYYSKNDCWPTTDIGLRSMAKPPKDPWGNNYRYEYTGNCKGPQQDEHFILSTLGKDQQVGGAGENADRIYRSDVYGLEIGGKLKIF